MKKDIHAFVIQFCKGDPMTSYDLEYSYGVVNLDPKEKSEHNFRLVNDTLLPKMEAKYDVYMDLCWSDRNDSTVFGFLMEEEINGSDKECMEDWRKELQSIYKNVGPVIMMKDLDSQVYGNICRAID